jgi:hypothetical protein
VRYGPVGGAGIPGRSEAMSKGRSEGRSDGRRVGRSEKARGRDLMVLEESVQEGRERRRLRWVMEPPFYTCCKAFLRSPHRRPHLPANGMSVAWRAALAKLLKASSSFPFAVKTTELPGKTKQKSDPADDEALVQIGPN